MKLSHIGLMVCVAACGPIDSESGTDTTSPPAKSTDTDPATTATDPTEATGTPTASTATDTVATDTASTDTGGSSACEDHSDLPNEAICDWVRQTCVGPCMDTPDELNDEAALQCALEALRDRTPGMLQWERREGEGGSVWKRVFVVILDDGTAYVARKEAVDVDEWTGPDGFESLQEPAYFADCLLEPDVIARFECLRGGLGEPLEECAPRTQTHSD